MQRDRAAEARWIEKENRWCIQVQSNGIRRRFYSSVSGKKGKVQAERKADEWLSSESLRTGVRVDAAWKSYLQYLESEGIETAQYKSIGSTHVVPAIGKKRVNEVTEFDLQSILTNGFNKGLSHKTLKNIRGCISSFMKYCRMRKLTSLYPENIKVNKKAKKPSKRTMQPEDISVLFSKDISLYRGKESFDWFIYAYRFQVSTGLRPSELLGLKRSDVDEENNTVSISRGYRGKGLFSEGKNENACRIIVLNQYALDAYNNQIEHLKKNKVRCVWLFPDRDKKICEHSTYEESLHRYCEYNGLPLYTPYELRHTYVSVNRYMPEELLKLQVGHSASMDTRGVYGHEINGDSVKAAELAGKAFRDILKSKSDTKVIPKALKSKKKSPN